MELSEVRGLETVVERLAAGGPSGIMPPHCWFCGKIEAWFRCDCKDAIDAREGKRPRPRVVERDGHMLIILEPEVMAREHNLRRKRFEPVHADVVMSYPVDSVDSAPAIVDNISDAAARRRAYKAEHERRRRAMQRG